MQHQITPVGSLEKHYKVSSMKFGMRIAVANCLQSHRRRRCFSARISCRLNGCKVQNVEQATFASTELCSLQSSLCTELQLRRASFCPRKKPSPCGLGFCFFSDFSRSLRYGVVDSFVDDVLAPRIKQGVDACVSGERVEAESAADRVVTILAGNLVVARTAVDRVAAAAPF